MGLGKEILPGVYHLGGVWGAGIFGANVFLLAGDTPSLVDTGFKGRAPGILKEIRRLGYSPSDIVNIIITHHHADHIGSLAALKKATKAKVIAHPADAPYIEGRLPQPGPAEPQWFGKLLMPLHWLWKTAPVAVDMLVDDGDELPILGGTRVLHTPGHTPGSISLFLQHKRLVLAGDVLAHRYRLSLPPKTWTVDIAQAIHSIKKVASLDFDVICFGHGSPLVHKAHSSVVNFVKMLESQNSPA
jgi:glyoxylase-like metal-dependent hydrolase (beta-lactamase superfamily II)